VDKSALSFDLYSAWHRCLPATGVAMRVLRSEAMTTDMSEAGFFRVERLPRPALARHVELVWAARDGEDAPLLPDAAVELVWSGAGLFVRGADTRPHAVGSFPERTFVVVRFRPGAAADVLGLYGQELADARVGISALWGRAEMERLESRLAACASHVEAADVLENAVESRMRAVPDPAVEAVVSELRSRDLGIALLARRIGLSERQLLRRCTAALGYGPKTLGRILRFQRFRALAATRTGAGLAELAADARYADQPHLTRECVRLAGATPAELVARL
jgi:AraC-like DNA-binding protein